MKRTAVIGAILIMSMTCGTAMGGMHDIQKNKSNAKMPPAAQSVAEAVHDIKKTWEDDQKSDKKKSSVLQKVTSHSKTKDKIKKALKKLKDRLNRGDPKTWFHKWQNKWHSWIHRPKPAPTPSPTPTPVPTPIPTPLPTPVPSPTPTPDPAPDPEPSVEPTPQPTPEPSPEPTPSTEPTPPPVPSPEYQIDLTASDWQVASQYGSGTTEWFVYFKPTASGTYELLMVSYDTTSRQATSVKGFIAETVYELPDLSSYTLVLTTTLEDGTTTRLYGLFDEGMTLADDVSHWIDATYDLSNTFKYAIIRATVDLPLGDVKVPEYDSLHS